MNAERIDTYLDWVDRETEEIMEEPVQYIVETRPGPAWEPSDLDWALSFEAIEPDAADQRSEPITIGILPNGNLLHLIPDPDAGQVSVYILGPRGGFRGAVRVDTYELFRALAGMV